MSKLFLQIFTKISENVSGNIARNISGNVSNLVFHKLLAFSAGIKDTFLYRDQAFCPEECKHFMRIGFLDWMLFNVPPMLLNTLVCWLYLQVHFLGLPASLKFWQRRKDNDALATLAQMEATLEKSIKSALRQKYEELGAMSLHEIGVLVIFVITIILWIFKDPQFIPGWDSIPVFKRTASGKSFIKESTPTLLMCVFLFAIPKKKEYYDNFRTGGKQEQNLP